MSAFEDAVRDPSRNLLVVAPPGCGKTELLARRAELLIDGLGPHQRILALTFSNKAKANLAGRLVTALGAERKRRHLAVRNFHGHATEIIRCHGRTLGIATDFSQPNDTTFPGFMAEHVQDLSDNEASALNQLVADELRVVKQRPIDDDELLAALTGAHPVTVEVELARQRAGALFYDDLLRHAQRLLRVPEVAHLYRCHYAAMLVDEFQDLSPQQLDIALRSCDASRTFAGDPLQGIYSWTGARPVQVEKVLRRIGGPPCELGVSHRSSPRVLEALAGVSVQLGGQPLECFEPDAWFEGGVAAGEAFDTGAEEARFIHDNALSILAKSPNATVGVICRSGWRRKQIDAEFEARGTPCIRWEQPLEDPRVLELIAAAVGTFGAGVNGASLQAHILTTLDVADTETIAEVFQALTDIEEIATATGSSMSETIARLLAESETEAAETIAPGVHLLNAHKGKGQQFDWVFIPGLEDGHIPSFLAKGSPSQTEEEHRVLLVMLSRARHGVVLTRANSLISKAGKPYSTKATPWLTDFKHVTLLDAAELDAHIGRLPAA